MEPQFENAPWRAALPDGAPPMARRGAAASSSMVLDRIRRLAVADFDETPRARPPLSSLPPPSLDERGPRCGRTRRRTKTDYVTFSTPFIPAAAWPGSVHT
jgi:hypothetical protein